MKKKDSRLRTLQVLGQPVYYLALPEGNFVLIRPICELLGVEADGQLEKLKADEIFGPERAEQPVQVPGHDQSRTWICLSEKYIYGWIISIPFTNTMKPETKAQLVRYKRECYEVLYNHFHGKIKEALELDKATAVITLQIAEVEKRLKKKLENDPDQLLKQQLETKKEKLVKAKTQNRKESEALAIQYALDLQPMEQLEAYAI